MRPPVAAGKSTGRVATGGGDCGGHCALLRGTDPFSRGKSLAGRHRAPGGLRGSLRPFSGGSRSRVATGLRGWLCSKTVIIL